ncbi:MAG: hypothetical protein H6700_08840 [Myxococcales bacterium]|nr:hypothetical protein [Myxococcales bacterium]MCB9521109.1 hypothetical protein [Myxococcales bacterium]MCB9531857.1 hypothetical protein [Myxococcales bacterium]
MSRLLLCLALASAGAVAACGTDDITVNVNTGDAGGGGGGGSDTGGGGGGGTDPGPGPANEVDATISGGAGGTVDLEGESDTSAEGQYYATVAAGLLDVTLFSTAGAVTFHIDATDAEMPGQFTVNMPPEGSFATVATAGMISNSTGGSISINQCPGAVGSVITGTFNNISLEDAMGGAGGTLSGTFRATLVISDESITCHVEPETDAGGGGTDAGGGGGSCDLSVCDGPCCPYVEPIATCQQGCGFSSACMNPMDPTGCIQCFEDCVTDSGAYEDAACSSLYPPYEQCEQNSGCAELEGDAYDSCLEQNCCDEIAAAF